MYKYHHCRATTKELSNSTSTRSPSTGKAIVEAPCASCRADMVDRRGASTPSFIDGRIPVGVRSRDTIIIVDDVSKMICRVLWVASRLGLHDLCKITYDDLGDELFCTDHFTEDCGKPRHSRYFFSSFCQFLQLARNRLFSPSSRQRTPPEFPDRMIQPSGLQAKSCHGLQSCS